jgi:anaerobic magnesium-protoporphyrin IX monomethyl ester cyclase
MNLSGKDLILVNSPGKEKVYQSLAGELAAFEPPIWAALIAEFIRNKGMSVGILDAEALQLSLADTAKIVADANPKLAVMVVYGQQPSASTQCMPAAGEVHANIKKLNPKIKTMFIGTHPSALPERTLVEEKPDFVCAGEGPYTILEVLNKIKANDTNYKGIGGLWFMEGALVQSSPMMAKIKDLDAELPGMAWDLLPMDKYRAHNWHCWDHINERSPYASLYTSLGCPYKCTFCCINAPFGGSGIRYFSPEWTIKQLDILVEKYGVKNIKIADEMFVLHPTHVLGICDHIIKKGYDLNIWAYARVDTIKDEFLLKLRKAGFRWLGLGIESGSKFVRDGVSKGRFGDIDIKAIVRKVQDAGIYVGANYIFGLPDDDYESMMWTLDMALELNTEWANFYSAMAYPGSNLHKMATTEGMALPENPGGPHWIGYSQHSKECMPMDTQKLPAREILAFRDYAFEKYFTNPKYFEMMEKKFGKDVIKHIHHMNSHKLHRNNAISREELMRKLRDVKNLEQYQSLTL